LLLQIIKELHLETDSKLVKGWSKEFNIPEKYILIVWKSAICDFMENGKNGCKPNPDDWPIIVNIFKAKVKKWLSKIEKDIKYIIKNPIVNGKKVHIHYDEAKKISLKRKIKEYEEQLKDCCNKCKSICK